MEITKQSVIGDVLDFAPETAEFFFVNRKNVNKSIISVRFGFYAIKASKKA